MTNAAATSATTTTNATISFFMYILSRSKKLISLDLHVACTKYTYALWFLNGSIVQFAGGKNVLLTIRLHVSLPLH